MTTGFDNQVAPPVPPIEVALYGEGGPDHSIRVLLTPRAQQALAEATERHPELTVTTDGDSVANLLMRLANLTFVAYDIGGRLYLKPAAPGQPMVQCRFVVGDRRLETEGRSSWSLKAWLQLRWERRSPSANRAVILIVRRSTFGYVERLAGEQGISLTDAINQMLQVGGWIDTCLAGGDEVMIRRQTDGALVPVTFS